MKFAIATSLISPFLIFIVCASFADADMLRRDDAESRVDICHKRSGSAGYRKIRIADYAVTKHIAHGDGLPGSCVPGMPGNQFDINCAVYKSSNEESFTKINNLRLVGGIGRKSLIASPPESFPTVAARTIVTIDISVTGAQILNDGENYDVYLNGKKFTVGVSSVVFQKDCNASYRLKVKAKYWNSFVHRDHRLETKFDASNVGNHCEGATETFVSIFMQSETDPECPPLSV
ncbi:hypothetical protein ACA910_017290 [Epithemia clementina (nom. ined.)]